MEPLKTKEDDEIINSLVEYLVRTTFSSLELNENTRVPIEKLQQIVNQQGDAVDLLLGLAGAERNQSEELVLDGGVIPKKQPKVKLRPDA